MDQKEIKGRLGYFMFLNDVFKSGSYAKLSPSAKSIYPVIGVHINRDGEAFLSTSRIEKFSGLSRHSVIDGVRELVENGFIIKIKGNSLKSNRFRIVFEYEGSVMLALRQCNNYTSSSANNIPRLVQKPYQRVVQKFHPNKVIYNKVTQSSKKKQQITTNIIKINDSHVGQVNIGENSGGNILKKIIKELNLKETGQELLEKYITNYSENWVDSAFTESVKRAKPSLHYMEGILKKWRQTGRIQTGSFKEEINIKKKEDLKKNGEEKEKLEQSRALNESLEQIFNSLEEEERENIEQRVRFEVDKLKIKTEFEGPMLRSTRLKILKEEFLEKENK